ncbi:reverse transcriptase domain-containing protein [Tanacetum coccineum]
MHLWGADEGMFLGHVIITKGIRVCPEKAKAVVNLQRPRTLKEVQILNGKLVSLNRFLSKSAKKALPFFKTLKNNIRKSDFEWTMKAEKAIQEMKRCIVELPMLTATKPRDELIMYLYVNREAISMPDGKANTGLGARNKEAKKILSSTPDFTAEKTDKDASPTGIPIEEEISEPWTLFTDGSSSLERSRAGLILTNPEGMKFTYALRFEFVASNIEAEYEALVDCESRNKWVFGLPEEIISDNGKQFRDNPFKDWCDKLNIKQNFASVKHPQTNGLVERANCILGEGIKARVDQGSKNWVKEVPHMLWTHRTMIKTSNGDTPFSPTYNTEAVIPVEIGMPSLRCAEVDQVRNDEALMLNLDMLEEKRERATKQPSSQETLYTEVTKLPTRRKTENCSQNGKDHTK